MFKRVFFQSLKKLIKTTECIGIFLRSEIYCMMSDSSEVISIVLCYTDYRYVHIYNLI